MGSSTSIDPGAKAKMEKKRYLILTYAGEFDRVHYPLPLKENEDPSKDALRNTIYRLRSEIDTLRSRSSVSMNDTAYSHASSVKANAFLTSPSNSSVSVLSEENVMLKQKIALLESNHPGAVNLDSLYKNNMVVILYF
jgi:coiled-coil domain-containing protein 61